MPLMSPLVIASHNKGKVREIGELLQPYKLEVLSAGALGLPEPEETGATFEENAAIKSLSAAKLSGHWSLADDSGLCVQDLDGAPGIYSARWAGEQKDFSLAMQRIEKELKQRGLEPEGAKAYFICALSLASPQGELLAFEGRVDGTLTFPPRGEKGFGYDPIFIPQGHIITFAQMESQAKHAMSHRAKALQKLEYYFKGAAA